MADENELTIKEIEDSWDELSEFEKRSHLETREFSKEFLEASWEDMGWEERCLTGRQENMTFEFLKDKWERLDATQRVSVFLFCEVPLEFTQKVWPELDSYSRSAAMLMCEYSDKFVEEHWEHMSERERDLYIKYGAALEPNFIAEYWPQFTDSQKTTLRFRKLIKGITKDHCPVFLTDEDPDVRAEAVKRMNGTQAEEDE